MSGGSNEPLLAQFEEYLVQSQLSPSTVVNYMADFRAFVRWGEAHIGPDFLLTNLFPNTIRDYRSHLFKEKGRAVSTVNRQLQTLRKFCAFATQAGLMTSNPAEGIRPIYDNGHDAGDATPEPLTADEIETLLNVSSSDQPSLARRDAAIVTLLIHTGLRVTELVELHLGDVHFDHPGIHLTVKNGTHNGTRSVPLEGEARQLLYNYLTIRPNVEGEDHLFLSREGRPLSARSVQRIVSLRARAAGLTGVSCQALRRTYANRLLAATGDLKLVSERLGHQNLATTMRYVNPSADEQIGGPNE
jgi:integrase/recombinase XerD